LISNKIKKINPGLAKEDFLKIEKELKRMNN